MDTESRKRRDQLVQLRGILKGKITRLANYLERSGPYADITAVDLKLTKIQEEFEKLQPMTEELIELEPEADHETISENIDYEYEDVMAVIRRLKNPSVPPHTQSQNGGGRSPTTSHGSANAEHITKIPKIELKKFDGSLEKWRSYRDWFLSTIHNRDGLSDANRLDYLQATLTGEAARTIEAFESTDSNYAEAWKLLEATYDNERILILRHYTVLLETPAMQKNSAEEIRNLLNRIQTHILAMKALGEKVEQWNTPLVHLIYTRLHKDTAREWNRRIEGSKMPNYETIVAFLREEAIRIAPMTMATQQSSGSRTSQQRNGAARNNGQRVQALITTTEAPCPLCKEPHKISKCARFIALGTPDRIQAARQASLCLNCLRGSHKTSRCKSATCSTCKKRHNAMLHLTPEELAVAVPKPQPPIEAPESSD